MLYRMFLVALLLNRATCTCVQSVLDCTVCCFAANTLNCFHTCKTSETSDVAIPLQVSSATCNQPTAMLRSIKAIGKGMLLWKIIHRRSHVDALGLFVRHDIHIVCWPRELVL